MTTFRIICIHELCFEHKVKSPFPHNETFYNMITFTFQLMPCTMHFFFPQKVIKFAIEFIQLGPFDHSEHSHTDSTFA